MASYDHASPNIIALAVILGVASVISVLLRIWARVRSKAHLGVDDVFAVVALCGFLAYLGLVILGPVLLRTCLLLLRLLQLTAFAESQKGLRTVHTILPPSVLRTNIKVR